MSERAGPADPGRIRKTRRGPIGHAVRLRLLAICLTVLVAAATLALTQGPAAAAADGSTYRRLRFPVEGAVTYGNDFGAARSGGRSHEGNDLMGRKLQPLLAARAGKIGSVKVDSGTNSGNMLTIVDAEGWQYWYLHVNNDAPGTDDGSNPPEFRFAAGHGEGRDRPGRTGGRVPGGQRERREHRAPSPFRAAPTGRGGREPLPQPHARPGPQGERPVPARRQPRRRNVGRRRRRLLVAGLGRRHLLLRRRPLLRLDGRASAQPARSWP